jgi:hypothetical protein
MLPLDEFSYHDAAGDDGQVSGQAAGTSKAAEDNKIVLDDGHEDIGAVVLNILGAESHAAGPGGVAN